MKKSTLLKMRFLLLSGVLFFLSPMALKAETVPFTKYAIEDGEKITIKNGAASAAQFGESIEKSFDGNTSTWYHSPWGGTTFPVTLTYNLNEASDLDYFVYTTRTDGSVNGNFKEFDVLLRKTGETIFTKVMTKNLNGAGGAWKIPFETTQTDVESVRFIVKSGAGPGNGFAAVAEMEFFKNKPGAFDYALFFEDKSCTTLKSSVTRSELEAITNPFYRQLALDIYDQKYATEFRIQDYKFWPHPDDFSRNNRVGTYSLCDNPTGIYMQEGDTVIVFVEKVDEVPISLTLKNYDATDGNGYWQNTYYGLAEGVNRVVANQPGLLYVFNHNTELYASIPPVKIHFAYGKVNGYYDSEKHSESDWTRILNASQHEYFDALGKYAHLSFPTAKFKQNAMTTGPELVAAYNEMTHMEREHMGYYKYPNRDPKNRSHFVVMYHSYMYSTSYHTGYNIGTMDELTNVSNFRKYPWGPAHEIGHSNQHFPLLNWIGTTEVTNNIHSLLVQTTWGNTSRLIAENRYQQAFDEIIVGKKAHGEAEIWSQLATFWQLQLLFANVLGEKDYYSKIYEGARTRPTGSNDGQYVMNFVKLVSDSTQYDMTEYFETWGFFTPVDITIEDYATRNLRITQPMITQVRNHINTLNRPPLPYKIQYITDTNWEVYRDKAEIVVGKSIRAGNEYTMHGWENVVAYEAWSGDEIIVVTQGNKLTTDGAKSTKVYAVQYDGTKIEVVPDIDVSVQEPKISVGAAEHWYYVKNMSTETSNSNQNRSFASLASMGEGKTIGADVVPVFKTQQWKLVEVGDGVGLVNRDGHYLGADLKATTSPYGWELERVTNAGVSGYRFASYNGEELEKVVHLGNNFSLMNYSAPDAASVWQFITADVLRPSGSTEDFIYSVMTLRSEAGAIGKSIAYNETGTSPTSQGEMDEWKVVNYNAETGACNLINNYGKYLIRSGSNARLSTTPGDLYIYLVSLNGVVGHRIAATMTNGSIMINMATSGSINTSSILTNGALWQFSQKAITSTKDVISGEEVNAYVRNGQVFLTDDVQFDLYSIGGQKVVNRNLAPGLYIVKSELGVVKVLVGK